MLTQRQLLILQLIIQQYTKTLEPVGSKTLLQVAELPYSSATIRNEMMKLEEMGFLEKNHSSSGRIPSNKGYRFYLDFILPQQQHSVGVRKQIRESLTQSTYEMRDLFHLSADILSTLTSYTCISLGPELSGSLLTGFRLVRLNAKQVMAILVTDKGFVENKVFSVSNQTDDASLERIVCIINDELVGLPLTQVINRLQTDLPHLMSQYVHSQIHVASAIYDMIHQLEIERVHVAGKQHLLNFIQSYAHLDHVKEIYQLMEDTAHLNRLIQTDEEGVQVRLGSETGNPYLKDFSIITTSYRLPNQTNGVIALLGPVNMPYIDVLSIVKSLRLELSDTMNHYFNHDLE